jgi:hypothetical protein
MTAGEYRQGRVQAGQSTGRGHCPAGSSPGGAPRPLDPGSAGSRRSRAPPQPVLQPAWTGAGRQRDPGQSPAIDGRRFTAFATTRRPSSRTGNYGTGGGPGAKTASGMPRTPARNLPLKGLTQNQLWSEIVSLACEALACEPLAWAQVLALTGAARRAPGHDPAGNHPADGTSSRHLRDGKHRG